MNLLKSVKEILLEGSKCLRILVIGDVMIDYSFYGEICQDLLAHQSYDPTTIHEAKEANLQPGGAAYFAAMMSHLAEVDLVGITGHDILSTLFEKIMAIYEKCHLYLTSVDDRPTTLKIRWFQWQPGIHEYLDGPFRIDLEKRNHLPLQIFPLQMPKLFFTSNFTGHTLSGLQQRF